MRKKYFIEYRALPILFLILLILPFLNRYFPVIERISSTENRTLASLPEFDIEHLDPFPEKYEEYYNDNFSLRNNFNSYYSYVKFKFLNINPFPHKVVLGDDHWMFFSNKMIPKYRESNLLSKNELEKIKNELIARENFLKEHNCSLYIGIIPSKASIYYDKINEPYRHAKDDTIPTLGDQFESYMASSAQLKILNLKPVYLALKNKYNLYRKYDHHFNNLAGFFASQAMIKMINNDFPGINMQLFFDDFELKYKSEQGGNLAKLLGVDEYCEEDLPYLTVKNKDKKLKGAPLKNYPCPKDFEYKWAYETRKTTQHDSLPNCMVIRDSFGAYYMDYMSHGFNNTFFLWDKWNYEINKSIFLEENPDVLIIMIPESAIAKFMNPSN